MRRTGGLLETGKILYLPAAQIRPNPGQPRKIFDPAGLQELAASIAEYGIVQPLTVGGGTDSVSWSQASAACARRADGGASGGALHPCCRWTRRRAAWSRWWRTSAARPRLHRGGRGAGAAHAPVWSESGAGGPARGQSQSAVAEQAAAAAPQPAGAGPAAENQLSGGTRGRCCGCRRRRTDWPCCRPSSASSSTWQRRRRISTPILRKKNAQEPPARHPQAHRAGCAAVPEQREPQPRARPQRGHPGGDEAGGDGS